jgi:CDP-diacylglycerol--glycerol-3-phosphate 3-phosphatidyltransferase
MPPVNLPNAITLGRIFLVPFLVVVLLTNVGVAPWAGVGKEYLGAGIFAVASLTDWLDGYLARRRQQVTGFGQWMDPLADKLLVTAALISLIQLNLVPTWMVAVILGREFVITVLRSIAHARGLSLPASWMGKLKMVAQVVAILALILGHGSSALGHGASPLLQVGMGAMWVAMITGLVSAVDYSRHFNAAINGRAVPAPVAPPARLGAADPKPARNRVSV